MSESWWERFGTKRDTVDVQEGVELKEQLKKKKKKEQFLVRLKQMKPVHKWLVRLRERDAFSIVGLREFGWIALAIYLLIFLTRL